MRPASWFVTLACLVAVVNDGWSGRPTPLIHQVLILPLCLAFVYSLARLLRAAEISRAKLDFSSSAVRAWLLICGLFEACSLTGFEYEAHHFRRFGYHLTPVLFGALIALFVVALAASKCRPVGPTLLAGSLLIYSAGAVVSLFEFPLNYLRSDMLPVILWADQRLLSHLNPYGTMHIADRVYDFPYLPGVLLAYLPVVALHLDPRWFNLVCVLALVCLLYQEARPAAKKMAAVIISIFCLSPFLQYRHELYLQAHWLTLAGTMVLLQRRRWLWAAAVFGVSMAIYQLSWVLWPFLLLYAFRRRGWAEALKTGLISLATMALMVGPFLAAAIGRIASNTVGQWSRLPHALADPINLSYWLTYLVRPDQLKWVQLGVLTAVFAYCVGWQRCRSLCDTLRWMSAALAIFIALNVIVDGYFYLTLLLVLLMYTLTVEGIWAGEDDRETEFVTFQAGHPSS